MKHAWKKTSDNFSLPFPNVLCVWIFFFFFFLTFGLGWMRLTTHHLVSKYFYRREFKYHRIRVTAQVIWVFFQTGFLKLNMIILELGESQPGVDVAFRWELTMLTNWKKKKKDGKENSPWRIFQGEKKWTFILVVIISSTQTEPK